MIRQTTKWTWHMISGVVVLVFLGLHMLITHLDDTLGWFNPSPGGSIAWENVVHRAQMLFFPITYVVLLAAALYHGFFGLKVILHELNPSLGMQRTVTGVLWVAGIVLFVIGVVTLIVAAGAA